MNIFKKKNKHINPIEFKEGKILDFFYYIDVIVDGQEFPKAVTCELTENKDTLKLVNFCIGESLYHPYELEYCIENGHYSKLKDLLLYFAKENYYKKIVKEFNQIYHEPESQEAYKNDQIEFYKNLGFTFVSNEKGLEMFELLVT